MDLGTVEREARAAALAVRGGFHPRPADAVPALPDGAPAGTVVLLGNVGSSLWAAFAGSGYLDGRPDPLDDWSRAQVGGLARTLGAAALFPFDGPPFLPFVRWAQRAEPVFVSLLGPLIHPEYGLWHAYRGALALPERLDLPGKQVASSPCESCIERPCLVRCPAGAVAAGRYDVPRCVQYLATHPDGACMTRGCQARHACPVGARHRYRPEQARHHMAVFVRNNQERAGGKR